MRIAISPIIQYNKKAVYQPARFQVPAFGVYTREKNILLGVITYENKQQMG